LDSKIQDPQCLRIGIDLDNTIISYENIFHSIAKNHFLIKESENIKNDLRSFLRSKKNGEIEWQKVQADVYGKYILKAKLFEGVYRFLYRAKINGHKIFIISHKTRFSSCDKTVNLRKAATEFLEGKEILNKSFQLFDELIFSNTRAEKISEINRLGLDFFIDDLQEVLNDHKFNNNTCKILFGKPSVDSTLTSFEFWGEIESYILGNISKEEIQRISNKLNLIPPNNLEKYHSGLNSSTWGFTKKSKKFVLKVYSENKANFSRRDNEYSALKLLESNNFRNIPKLIYTNEKFGFSVISHIENTNQVLLDDKNLNKVIVFIKSLKNLSKKLPNFDLASDACISGQDIVDQIQRRLNILLNVSSTSTNMNNFLRCKFLPTFDKIVEFSKKNWPKNYSFDQQINKNLLLLNPSDIAAHNMIENRDLFFIDFEYFGYDDPVKTVSDFLLHPKNKLNSMLIKKWISETELIFKKDDPDFSQRFKASWPLYGLCWVLIFLKEFDPNSWTIRKHFKSFKGIDKDYVKFKQLAKAEHLLDYIRLSYKNFPNKRVWIKDLKNSEN